MSLVPNAASEWRLACGKIRPYGIAVPEGRNAARQKSVWPVARRLEAAIGVRERLFSGYPFFQWILGAAAAATLLIFRPLDTSYSLKTRCKMHFQGLGRSDIYSQRIRFVFMLLLVLFALACSWELLVDRSFKPEEYWRLCGYYAFVGGCLAMSAIRNFIRISEVGIDVYTAFGKRTSRWDNVEGVADIKINGRPVRCIVTKRPLATTGWDLSFVSRIPRAYRGRIVPIPESGPESYHDSARLILEVERRASASQRLSEAPINNAA